MSTTPRITICVQCHNFQRRFRWMLSSLAQQTDPGLAIVAVAYMRDNGTPTTEELVLEFEGRVQTQPQVFLDRHEFERRGLTRNRQLAEALTPWVMFADCDMVYHPEWMASLVAELESNHRGARYMLSAGRMSNPAPMADALVYSTGSGATEVPDAWGQADKLLPKRKMANVGAGFCQIVHRRRGAHGGYYVRADECADWDWGKRGSNPRSDMQFRRRVSRDGGPRIGLPKWFAQNSIHLNHERDPEAGHHLETQR